MKAAFASVASAYLIVLALVVIGNGIAVPECVFKACSGFPLWGDMGEPS